MLPHWVSQLLGFPSLLENFDNPNLDNKMASRLIVSAEEARRTSLLQLCASLRPNNLCKRCKVSGGPAQPVANKPVPLRSTTSSGLATARWVLPEPPSPPDSGAFGVVKQIFAMVAAIADLAPAADWALAFILRFCDCGSASSWSAAWMPVALAAAPGRARCQVSCSIPTRCWHLLWRRGTACKQPERLDDHRPGGRSGDPGHLRPAAPRASD
jgi:hypothetical protein